MLGIDQLSLILFLILRAKELISPKMIKTPPTIEHMLVKNPPTGLHSLLKIIFIGA